MNVNFKKIAQKATVLSELMEGRDQIKTDEIIRLYPEGITVTAFDFVTLPESDGEAKMYPCCVFKEDSTKYFNGGYVLKKIFDAVVHEFDGDVTGASEELAKAGGLRLRFVSTKTKNGNNLTAVEVL